MRKEVAHVKRLRDGLVLREFFAIIRGNSMEGEAEGLQQGNHGGGDGIRTAARDLGDETQPGFAFG